jgi:hypothetical protein
MEIVALIDEMKRVLILSETHIRVEMNHKSPCEWITIDTGAVITTKIL